jgi:tetratricopeptide (TPR) repeat protein
LAVTEDPTDSRNCYYHARELFFYQKFEDSRKEFLRYLSLPDSAWKPERSSAMRYIAKTYIDEKQKEYWLKKAVRESPERREPLVDISLFYYNKEEWKKALSYLKKVFAIKEKSLGFLCEEFAWSELPYDIAAICYHKIGDNKKAKEYNDKALEITPNNERLKNNSLFYI